MAEQENVSAEAPKEKKWTSWSVVSTEDGTYRCKRTNVADDKDAEYQQVPRPTFSPTEISGMIKFGRLELIEPNSIANLCYERRYRTLAFSLCSQLNERAQETK